MERLRNAILAAISEEMGAYGTNLDDLTEESRELLDAWNEGIESGEIEATPINEDDISEEFEMFHE